MRIVEVGAIGPAPVAGMLLADLGAEVILVDRKTDYLGAILGKNSSQGDRPIFNRGKKSIALDLKKPEAIATVKKLVATADGLIEGFRPGVMEQLGLGPDECLEVNPSLVYGRMTGWGQDGPLVQVAGHDLNYIALSGALNHSGSKGEAPSAPPTYIGDVGGGAFMLTIGMLAALLQVSAGGQGQVVDAAISDGSALMSVLLLSLRQMGLWTDNRADNMLDGGAPWYNTYECADHEFVTVAALEPKFYQVLIQLLNLEGEPDFSDQMDKARWPAGKQKLSTLFKTKTRRQWCELLEGTDACFAPVLNFEEARQHPHHIARKTFINPGGDLQAAPAPRFSRTVNQDPQPSPVAGENTREILQMIGESLLK